MTIDLDNADPQRVEAVMETDKGTIVLGFFPEVAPKAVRNFLQLVQDGFYDGLKFHRIIKGFMIQSGCPRGDGTGGPGYTVEAEFSDTPHRRGVLSMARGRDPNSAGSQFFIVHGEHARHLDGQYTAFGAVTGGLDVLDSLAAVPTTHGSTGESSKPVEPVRIRKLWLRMAEPDATERAASEAGETGGDSDE